MRSYTPPPPYGARYADHDERRGANSKPRNMQPPQSRQAVNLSRLSAELGADVLGAALGLADQSLRILLDGRNASQEAQYQPHLEHKFEDAGIPLSWLSRENPTIDPEYLQALRALAAQAPNKAPIRRANFRRLAKAFDGRVGVLADAVEMNQAAVMNVAEGHLELDEYRFNHLNPRLMHAGFPDGWLEAPNPELSDSMLESLEQMATDEYEHELSSSEAVEQTVGQVFVSPAPAQVAAAQQKLAAAVAPAAAEPIESEKEVTMEPTAQVQPEPSEERASLPGFAKPEFQAAGFPGAMAPMPHPAAAGAKLPTRVLMAGRKVAGVGVKPAAPVKASAKVAAKAVKPQTKAAKPAPVKAAKPQAPAKGKGAISKELSLARANALNQLLDTARRGAKITLWNGLMELSLPYWGNIRRGAVLFRDELADKVVDFLGLPQGWLDNPTFPPATLAAWVTDASVPLPGPVKALAEEPEEAESVPVPVAEVAAEPAPQAAAPVEAEKAPEAPAVRPFSRPKKAPPVLIVPQVEPAHAPEAIPAVAAALVEAPAPVVQPEPVAAAAPVQAAPAPAASPSAPVVAQPTPQVKLSLAGFNWTPPQGQPGPICQALVSTLNGMSAAGVLTEQDALQMLNELLGRR